MTYIFVYLPCDGFVIHFIGTLLRRFRAGVRRIRSSPQRIEHYRRCCRAVETTRFITESDQDVYGDAVVDAESHVDGKMLVLDVRTRWNSTFHMIQRGLEMSRAYNMTCMGIPELNGHTLTDDDWSTLQQIATLLQPFADLTAVLGGSHYPSLSSTIIGYNVLMDHLEDFVLKQSEVCT